MNDEPLYAWCTMLDTGELSLVGILDEHGQHMPMIAFNGEHVRMLEPIARAHGLMLRQRVYLVRFSRIEVIDTIDPPPRAAG